MYNACRGTEQAGLDLLGFVKAKCSCLVQAIGQPIGDYIAHFSLTHLFSTLELIR